MKTIPRALGIVATLFVAACRNATGPTAPSAIPLIAGTWGGTVSVLSSEAPRCPVTVEIEQPSAGRDVTGTIRSDCQFALFYGRLAEGLPWTIEGGAYYSDYSYDTYSAPLNGRLEGSPVSRITATTVQFTTHQGSQGSPGIRLELTSRAP